MSRSTRVILGLAGASVILAGGGLAAGTLLPLVALGGAWCGGGLGALLARRATSAAPAGPARDTLLGILVEMGDLLQEMTPANLGAQWDQAQFARVLRRVERLTPALQDALIAYLAAYHPTHDCLAALLAVDRLSAAYTYWTRLFPPRQGGESMFVLSLLHDLSEKVEHAIAQVQTAAPG